MWCHFYIHHHSGANNVVTGEKVETTDTQNAQRVKLDQRRMAKLFLILPDRKMDLRLWVELSKLVGFTLRNNQYAIFPPTLHRSFIFSNPTHFIRPSKWLRVR